MAKFGVYRVEQSPLADAYTELISTDVIVSEGVYRFRDRWGNTGAAYPIRHFYIVCLED